MALNIRILALSIVAAMLLASAPLGCGGEGDQNGTGNGDDDVSPEQALLDRINTFTGAISEDDFEAAWNMIHPVSREILLEERARNEGVNVEDLDRQAIIGEMGENMRGFSLAEDPRVEVDGTEGTVYMVIHEVEDQMPMALVEGQWYFDPMRIGGGDDLDELRDKAMEQQEGAGQSTDRNNLSNLMEAFIVGQAMGLPTPSSTGYRFWIALFVGDGPGGAFVVESFEDETYLSPRSANLLRSPGDDEVMSREELERRLVDLIETGQGAAGATPDMCSYAGPRGYGANNSPRAALVASRNRSGLVGATGRRGGVGFFANGFNAVNQDGGANWYSYDELAEDEPAYEDAIAPQYGQGILEWVIFDEDDIVEDEDDDEDADHDEDDGDEEDE